MGSPVKIDFSKFKPLPIGNSGWADFFQRYYTVDKTLLIKDLIDDQTTVALFTRPRRFGKTTALQMIKAFFEKAPEDTSFLFKDTKVWAVGEKYRQEQGKYPIIYLTFKDITGDTFDEAFAKVKMIVARVINEHRDALDAIKNNEDRERITRVMAEKGNVQDVGAALGLLAMAVHLAEPNGVKPIILIDEYDAPVNNASVGGYLEEMTALMRSFLSNALKDNSHVKMGIMTGVLRVAKEGILSGLNNLKVWTVFSQRYTEYFGFTEDEVSALASYYGVPEKMAEIKSWYDGYDFGGVEIYNPWSVLNYFDNACTAQPYWLDTSSNDLITDIIRDLPHDTAETLVKLLRDGKARVRMAQELGPYAQIHNQVDTLYALLVAAGYLKCCTPIENGSCLVALPNRELTSVFVDDIITKINRGTGGNGTSDIADALIDGDPEAFRVAIQQFLAESVSYFDGAAEGFYHGMVLGFLAVLRNRYRVESNRESGNGRFDIALFPQMPNFPGVIIEVKAAKGADEDLKQLAAVARAQIDERQYAAQMLVDGVSNILKLGLAFYRKNVELKL